MRRFIVAWFIVAACMPCTILADGESVSLDLVEGLHATDSVLAETPIVFHIRMTFGDDTYWGISNAFRIYSPDSVEWDTAVGAWTGVISDSIFPQQYVIDQMTTGMDADTVGFAAFMWTEPTGIPPYFDDTTCTVTIGPIGPEHVGGTICLDSSFYRPSTRWVWVTDDWNNHFPAWDGPHCYTVVAPPSCCNIRGDIDHNGLEPDISDLIYLTTFMFQSGPPPPCMEEADVNDTGGDPDIADLMYLQSFMFGNPPGPAPVPCP